VDNKLKIKLNKEDKVLIITGAGISESAGIGSFKKIKNKINYNELLNINNIKKNKINIFENFVNNFYKEISIAKPTITHCYINKILKNCPKSLLLTQNIDGLHNKFENKVIEIHGNIKTSKCIKCNHEISTLNIIKNKLYKKTKCIYKPNITFFKEKIDEKKYNKVLDFLITDLLDDYQLLDYLFIIGTESKFLYIKKIIEIAIQQNSKIIIINPNKRYKIKDAKVNYINKKSDDFFTVNFELNN